jgi:hypothetical protein
MKEKIAILKSEISNDKQRIDKLIAKFEISYSAFGYQLKAGHLVISMSYSRVGTAHQIKAICTNHLLMVGSAHPTNCPALSW